MRILDRYATKQLLPVWVWCIVVFVFASCVIDLFEHLDEIIRYHLKAKVLVQYYLNFVPLVFVRASPIALLLSSAFVTMRLARHQEILAMNASGLSIFRASLPFLFVGWLVSVVVFAVNEGVVPSTAAAYERLRHEIFRAQRREHVIEHAATIDPSNRLYHARLFNPNTDALTDVTILEHDAHNRLRQTIHARQAFFTPHGWLLVYGTVSQADSSIEMLPSNPQPFVERLFAFPVTPEAFRQSETQPDTLSFSHLRQLVIRLKAAGIMDVRRYAVELASKVTLPLMNLVVCLIGFIGSARSDTRGRLQGLGASLGWGMLYYIGVAISHGMGKEGLLPAFVAVWVPHVVALGLCWRVAKRQS